MTSSLLHLKDIDVGYGGRAVLAGIDLVITPGRWLALVGPNASGKTTLLRTLAGRLDPVRGNLSLPAPLPALALPPDELPPFLTVQQCLSVHAAAHGLPDVPRASTVLANLLALDVHGRTLVRQASLGTRQKLSVVLALMLQPRVLLLDEIFNGLDFASALKLRASLREQVQARGLAIVLATHALDVVLQCCDELVLVEQGRLAARLEVAAFREPGGLSRLEALLAADEKKAPHEAGPTAQ